MRRYGTPAQTASQAGANSGLSVSMAKPQVILEGETQECDPVTITDNGSMVEVPAGGEYECTVCTPGAVSFSQIVADWQAANGNVHSYHKLRPGARLVDSGPNALTMAAEQNISTMPGPFFNTGAGKGIDDNPTFGFMTYPAGYTAGLNGLTGITALGYCFMPPLPSPNQVNEIFQLYHNNDVGFFRAYVTRFSTYYRFTASVAPAQSDNLVGYGGPDAPEEEWFFFCVRFDFLTNLASFRVAAEPRYTESAIPITDTSVILGDPASFTNRMFSNGIGVNGDAHHVGGISDLVIIKQFISDDDEDLFASATAA